MGILVFVLAIFITGCNNNNNYNNDDTALKPVAREEMSFNELVIEKNDITDIAKFYPVTVDGVEMEVIAVLATDGTIRTAFNACQVCASSGRGYYIQQGTKLVCQNCGNRFDVNELEVTRNGCNPAPIEQVDKSEDEEYITVPKATFIKNMDLFNY
jgi:uncharacterized membrane protein